MKERILITAALPYANGPLHFGHIAGAYLPADCFARFKRLQGNDVLFISGSDEYGIAIALSASMAGRTPQEQVDLFHAVNQDFFQKLKISFDHYSRTTRPVHAETAKEFFINLLHNGHVEERVTEQLFSEAENRFLADRYVTGTCPKCNFASARGDECPSCGASYEATDLIRPVSKLSGSPLIRKETKHWFLRFDHFASRLAEWIPTKHWKPNVTNFSLPYVKELRARAITRDSDWGIPVPLPGAEGKVFYVWFDAPIGYISATKDWAESKGDPEAWRKYWLEKETRYVQFIGKDNIPFHAVFFPAMIMGQDIPYKLVDDLPANEFYNLEGRQFSKSDGWTIDLASFFAKFSSDQIRYVIAANAPETSDSEFTWKDFQDRCNADLLGKFGNFVNRVLVFLQNTSGGVVPFVENLSEEDTLFLEKIDAIVAEGEAAYETFRLRQATRAIMELAQAGNVYFDAKKPWKAVREESCKQDLDATLFCCLECIKRLALLAFPVIPDTADAVAKFLGFTDSLSVIGRETGIKASIPSGTVLPPPHLLFSKIEEEDIRQETEELRSLLQKFEKSIEPLKPEIGIEEVRKLDLRVGKIVSVARMPKSKKLLKLSVDIGSEVRPVVAGIGEGREEIDSLIGTKVVIVANLKSATLMGTESRGMLLAAKSSSGLEPIGCLLSDPGDVVS